MRTVSVVVYEDDNGVVYRDLDKTSTLARSIRDFSMRSSNIHDTLTFALLDAVKDSNEVLIHALSSAIQRTLR